MPGNDEGPDHGQDQRNPITGQESATESVVSVPSPGSHKAIEYAWDIDRFRPRDIDRFGKWNAG
jgi:hypothetical protein